MNTSAIIMLVASEAIITYFTIYFFIKVLKSPGPKEENEEGQPTFFEAD
jgi:hypothetical protein